MKITLKVNPPDTINEKSKKFNASEILSIILEKLSFMPI